MGDKKIVVLRGRNTESISIEASRIYEGDVVVVCRDGDALKQPGDIEQCNIKALVSSWGEDVEVVCVANGGTTQQLFSVIKVLGRADYVDLQKDQKPVLLLHTLVDDVCSYSDGHGCSSACSSKRTMF
jgi:hypothetical protein